MTSQASTQCHFALNTTQRIRAHLSRVVDDGIHKHTHSLTKSSTTPMTFHPSPRRPSHHITPPRVITIQNLGTNLKPIERNCVDRFFSTHSLPSIYLPHPSSSNHPFRNTTHVSLQNIRHTHATHHTTQNNPKKVEQPRATTAQPAKVRICTTPPVPAYPFPVHLRPVRQLGPISQPHILA
jgi:hypothetical protein